VFGFLKKKIKEAISGLSKKVSKEEIEKEEKKVEDEVEQIERRAGRAEPEKKSALQKLKRVVAEKELSDEYLSEVLGELDLALMENNVAAETSAEIVAGLKKKLRGKYVKRAEAEKIIRDELSAEIRSILGKPQVSLSDLVERAKKENRPAVILFFGFNGTGKSLSVARLANILKKSGYKPLLAAGDTFRAAGIEQLEEYAKGVGVPVVKHRQGADSAAVIFDAVKSAKAKGFDVVLADTAGRAHTDRNLIEELKKIVKVSRPDLKILVCEAVAGSDVVNQARVFNEAAGEAGGIDGVILTKWDVDEKGGAALSVCHALQKPILFLGVGQKLDDLEPFDLEKAMRGIFG